MHLNPTAVIGTAQKNSIVTVAIMPKLIIVLLIIVLSIVVGDSNYKNKYLTN